MSKYHVVTLLRLRLGIAGAAALLAACATQPPATTASCPAAPPCPVCAVCPAAPPERPKVSVYEAVGYEQLPGWREDDLMQALPALRSSCRSLRFQAGWRDACARLEALDSPDAARLRAFFASEFTAYRIASAEGATQGLVTGYYEPLLRGSRERRGPYQVPLYAPPDDLLTIELASVHPDLKNMRLRGRLEGRRVVPYYSRAEIEDGKAPVLGKEIVWVDDPIEAFFLQIQGSGRVRLENGGMLRLGYADQNGLPYASIGRTLIDRAELQPGEASMQGIKNWARAHPERLAELLNRNPSYVFFKELPGIDAAQGPIGALGVPLTAQRSIAVDPRFIPLGAPVFLATTWPAREEPLARLVLAQDTGGAIRGAVRADFFWGFGAEAGEMAGKMRQEGRIWVLLPNGLAPPRP